MLVHFPGSDRDQARILQFFSWGKISCFCKSKMVGFGWRHSSNSGCHLPLLLGRGGTTQVILKNNLMVIGLFFFRDQWWSSWNISTIHPRKLTWNDMERENTPWKRIKNIYKPPICWVPSSMLVFGGAEKRNAKGVFENYKMQKIWWPWIWGSFSKKTNTDDFSSRKMPRICMARWPLTVAMQVPPVIFHVAEVQKIRHFEVSQLPWLKQTLMFH